MQTKTFLFHAKDRSNGKIEIIITIQRIDEMEKEHRIDEMTLYNGMKNRLDIETGCKGAVLFWHRWPTIPLRR